MLKCFTAHQIQLSADIIIGKQSLLGGALNRQRIAALFAAIYVHSPKGRLPSFNSDKYICANGTPLCLTRRPPPNGMFASLTDLEGASWVSEMGTAW